MKTIELLLAMLLGAYIWASAYTSEANRTMEAAIEMQRNIEQPTEWNGRCKK